MNGEDQLWDRNGGLPTLISTDTGDNYVHTAGIARDGDDWLLADAVGSVRATVDDAGNTVGSQDFTVFGEQLSGTGSFGFAGEQQDPTGQLHLRARQYNPSLGRFTSVDPVQPGAPATTGYNLYAYSGNNPTTWTDPSGRAVITEYGIEVSDDAEEAAVVAEATAIAEAAAGVAQIEAFLATTGAGGQVVLGLESVLLIMLGGKTVYDIFNSETPEKKVKVLPPTVEDPEPDSTEAEPEPQLATDGAGARDGGDACDAISVDDALQRISDFLGGDGRLVVSGSGNYQWIVTEQIGSSTVTRIGRLDINPNSPHVVKFRPHVNLETQIDGKTQRSGSLADPHIEVDASTVRDGDYPSC